MCSAAAEPANLLSSTKDSPFDEIFAFERCVSRLLEMQSKEYQDEIKKRQGTKKHE